MKNKDSMDGHPSTPGTDRISLPPRMKAALESYRKRVWTIKLAEGFLSAVFGLAVSYLTVFILDRILDTSSLLRGLILLLGSVGMVILFPLKYHNWVWSHRRLDQVARLLTHKFPRFGDHLLGIVELAQCDSRQGKSVELIQAAIRQVDNEMQDRDLSDAVPSPGHLRWAWMAGFPMVTIILLMLAIPDAGMNAMMRWIMPWRDVERYTFAQLQPHEGVLVVPYAEPFQVVADLDAESFWKPGKARARFGKQSPLSSTRSGLSYPFQIPPQTEDGQVLIRVGDARHFIDVEPKIRPALNELQVQVDLPDYLQRPGTAVQDARGGWVNPVRGSRVVFTASATRGLNSATLDDRPQQVEGKQLTTGTITVDSVHEFKLNWIDHFGLEAREPQVLRIEARDDAAPTVNLNRLKNNHVLLSTQLMTFGIEGSDDFGIRKIGIEWKGIPDPVQNPEPTQGEKSVAAGSPESEDLKVAATFSADRENIRPQSLRLRAYVEDYFPGRERSYSPPVVVHILTPSDHFKWLAEQMSQWAGAAQEVYDKELQLHQVNKELMNLPSEALDDPAQRKKVQMQAAGEKENAERLNTLIDIGMELIQEAARNEEFHPEQLDSWAEMLKGLEEIAHKKMPSVADLLAKAAEAPGQPSDPSSQTPPPGSGSEASPPQKPSEEPSAEGMPGPRGGKPNDLEKAEKYGPKARDIQGIEEAPEDPNLPGGEVNVDRSEPADGKPGYLPANPAPVVLDHESGFNKSEKAENAPQIKGGMGIPATLLKGSGNEEEENEDSEDTTVELVIEAVTEQQDLLDAFAKFAEEMNKLLMGFENSTFVKRLKAASRKQMDMSVDLNNLNGFGLAKGELSDLPQRKHLGEMQVAASEVIFLIQEDMDAYAARKPSSNYTTVLEEMQNESVVTQVSDLSSSILNNEVGQSTIEAEFWADTLDRWAEQLVDPLPPPGAPPSELIELPNLTPEIIVEILRILEREIQLREETRELDQVSDLIDGQTFQNRGKELSDIQKALSLKSQGLVKEIEKLPMQDHPLMQKHIQKVNDAVSVMNEVTAMLSIPITGQRTIAAITEVIEILLETGRVPNAPMVVKSPPASTPALLLMGIGDDRNRAFIEDRAPSQATGKAGRKLPEEFRQGLDAYLSALEDRTFQ